MAEEGIADQLVLHVSLTELAGLNDSTVTSASVSAVDADSDIPATSAKSEKTSLYIGESTTDEQLETSINNLTLDTDSDGESLDTPNDNLSQTSDEAVSEINSTMDQNNDESFKTSNDNLSENTEGADHDMSSMTDGQIVQPENRLHCALCLEISKEPKFLPCFHSFCLECLEKRNIKKRKFIFCPICRHRSPVPSSGLSGLPSNKLLSKMIEDHKRLASGEVGNCVVCQLHGEKKMSVGQCQTCGDLLCEDCCNKHTFSRLTATHKVINLSTAPISDDAASSNPLSLQINQAVFCSKHVSEELKFYCQNCSVPVCRDCIVLEHGKHTAVLAQSIFQKVKCEIEFDIKTLKTKCEKMVQDTQNESMDIIDKEEEEQMRNLDKAKEEAIHLIENKFHRYRDLLKEEFHKCRTYSDTRKKYLDLQRMSIETALGNIEFYLGAENQEMIVELQKPMQSYLHHLSINLQKTFSPLDSAKLPSLKVDQGKFAQISNQQYISIDSYFSAKKEGKLKNKIKTASTAGQETQQKSKQQTSESKKTNTQSFGSQSASYKAMQADKGVRNQHNSSSKMSYVQQLNNGTKEHNFPNRNQPISPLMASGNQRSIGRGGLLQQRGGSLLGNYQGCQGNTAAIGPMGEGLPFSKNNASYSGFGNKGNQMHGFSNASQFGQSKKVKTANTNLAFGRQFENFQPHHGIDPHSESMMHHSLGPKPVKMQLLRKFNCKTNKDKFDVEAAGLTFTQPNVIALSDAANRNLKLFDLSGEWLDLISDESPRSVTYCENHLVWNSMGNAAIKTYDICTQRFGPRKQFNFHIEHPLTSYRGVKYIVANLKNSQIQACTVSGEIIHTMVAKDSQGRVLQSVGQVAAFSDDQLVVVDKHWNRLIVNNFDGDFKGEFGGPDWRPGCVTIDNHSNIFVTDMATNRIILLSSRGKYLQEWTTAQERPFGLACNRNGIIAVAGAGNCICLYQYQY